MISLLIIMSLRSGPHHIWRGLHRPGVSVRCDVWVYSGKLDLQLCELVSELQCEQRQ